MPSHYVHVFRGSTPESRHIVHVAVVDTAGRLTAAAGDSEFLTFARSSVKPIQAIPLIEDGGAAALAFTREEIALCCASHSGEPKHVELAAGMLRKAGEDESALACGPQAPRYAPAAEALARSGEKPGRLHNNCSGKHAGMIALAKHHGWPVSGYHQADHPVQRRMLEVIAQWTETPASAIATAVDGCGVVTFAVPLRQLARAFATLAAATGAGAAGQIVHAMRQHPDLVAGTGRLCTALGAASKGRVIAKVGAEGVYCAAIPEMGLGAALKVEDGATRAAGPALLAVLRALGALGDEHAALLSDWREPEVRNTRGEVVGKVRAEIELR
jgi:L-asparaginase II